MGLLIPYDLPLESLDNESERRVVENFRDRLSDSWYIIPRVDVLTRRRPYEIDVLLFHENEGIIGVEVKGGPVRIEQGIWKRRGEIFEPSPPRQAQNAVYTLRNWLRDHDPMFKSLEITYAVALPDCRRFPIEVPEVTPEQVFFLEDLIDARESVDRLLYSRNYSRPLTSRQIEELVRVVRPTIDFTWDPESQAADARRSLNKIMRGQVDALATLDVNERVLVNGAAGTGKTQLAIEWARRASAAGEVTMLTCFNVPLGHRLRTVAAEDDLIAAGEFLALMLGLDGLPPFPVPDDADESWYREVAPQCVMNNLGSITDRFDTIVVDEIQDFHDEWIEVMLALLNEDGHLLVTGDNQQNLYGRRGIDRILELDPSQAELTENCRNTQQIGGVLRRLGGARTATASPDGQGVFFYNAVGDDAVLSVLEQELEDLIGTRSINPENVLIVTTSTKLRNLITAADPGYYDCTRWEDRGDGNIVCETVHRSKGLEYDAVILVVDRPDVSDLHLYVGASRAVSLLTVVGPPEIGQRLGLL